MEQPTVTATFDLANIETLLRELYWYLIDRGIAAKKLADFDYSRPRTKYFASMRKFVDASSAHKTNTGKFLYDIIVKLYASYQQKSISKENIEFSALQVVNQYLKKTLALESQIHKLVKSELLKAIVAAIPTGRMRLKVDQQTLTTISTGIDSQYQLSTISQPETDFLKRLEMVFALVQTIMANEHQTLTTEQSQGALAICYDFLFAGTSEQFQQLLQLIDTTKQQQFSNLGQGITTASQLLQQIIQLESLIKDTLASSHQTRATTIPIKVQVRLPQASTLATAIPQAGTTAAITASLQNKADTVYVTIDPKAIAAAADITDPSPIAASSAQEDSSDTDDPIYVNTDGIPLLQQRR